MEAWAGPIQRAVLEQLGGTSYVAKGFVTYGTGVDGFFIYAVPEDGFTSNRTIVVHLDG